MVGEQGIHFTILNILEKFMNKAQYHKTYVMYVNRQLKMDSEIISKINTEIEK